MKKCAVLLLSLAIFTTATTPRATAGEPVYDYVYGEFAFNMTLAQASCEALGPYDLATWENTADLELMISLCANSGESLPCFTRYQGNQTGDAHVSILDGSPMPEIPQEFWSSIPIFSPGVNVMVRSEIPRFYEILSAGIPLCVLRTQVFNDGFENGDLSAWSLTSPASPN